ncbi:MAG: 2-oxoacid:acceptor oxidoreductase family protein [Candidatus Eisenbacteria bacterium]|nr:2-oxoacid:acceptor oxidoreductase family protein [Candidatus Eisenbacteria bacterium]
MAQLMEIRWHARGGQGAKTASLLLAEAAAMEGKYSQGFPDYGPERMGAPMRGFTRISDEPVRVHCAIYSPAIVVVLDDTLLTAVDVADGTPSDGIIVVNTLKTAADVRKTLKLKGRKIFTVDATGIAIDEIGRPIPNAPMLGALIKVSDLLALEAVTRQIKKKFSHGFRPEVLEGNVRAIKRAYEEVAGE